MAEVRVLVTGGGGFVGRQIVTALARLGADVAAPVGARPDLLTPDGRADLLAATRPDTLVHAAWVTAPGDYWASAANIDWVTATIDLARRFRAGGGRRFVLVGSCAEYDWSQPINATWDEARACRPQSLYGRAKLLAWTSLIALAGETGLSAANARVFVPVGRHEAPGRLLPTLIRAARAGTELALGPAELSRDFLDVRDVGEAIALLALSDALGPVNIGAARPVSLGALVRQVPGAAQVVRFGERPARSGEPLWMVPDASRLQRLTGFLPRYTLDATVADALERADAPVA